MGVAGEREPRPGRQGLVPFAGTVVQAEAEGVLGQAPGGFRRAGAGAVDLAQEASVAGHGVLQAQEGQGAAPALDQGGAVLQGADAGGLQIAPDGTGVVEVVVVAQHGEGAQGRTEAPEGLQERSQLVRAAVHQVAREEQQFRPFPLGQFAPAPEEGGADEGAGVEVAELHQA